MMVPKVLARRIRLPELGRERQGSVPVRTLRRVAGFAPDETQGG